VRLFINSLYLSPACIINNYFDRRNDWIFLSVELFLTGHICIPFKFKYAKCNIVKSENYKFLRINPKEGGFGSSCGERHGFTLLSEQSNLPNSQTQFNSHMFLFALLFSFTSQNQNSNPQISISTTHQSSLHLFRRRSTISDHHHHHLRRPRSFIFLLS